MTVPHRAYSLQLLIIYFHFPVFASDLVIFIGRIILTTSSSPLSTDTPQKQNHRAVQLPISTTSPDLFHFQLSLPSYFQACFRSIGVQYSCHKSLRLRYSKHLKSLLYFPASLTVLLSIQDVREKKRSINSSDIEINQSINRAHISRLATKLSPDPLPDQYIHMCAVEKAARNQTFGRQSTRWGKEGRVIILLLVKKILPL